MKHFKLSFHIIYVLISLATFYTVIDYFFFDNPLLSIELFTLQELFEYFVLSLFLLSFLMLIEFFLERFNVYTITQGKSDLEEKIVKLKAKLYDQSDGEEEEEISDDE